MHLAPSQRTLDEGVSPSFCAGRKLGDVEKALLWTLLHEPEGYSLKAGQQGVGHIR